MHPLCRLCLILIGLTSSACAHKGAVKVECDGHLEPINRSSASDPAPVSVQPATEAPDRAKQP